MQSATTTTLAASSGATSRLWFWVLASLSLLLSSSLCFAQFNSITKKESFILVNIVPEVITNSNPKGVESGTFETSKINEAEDLKKAPELVVLTNVDKAEALIASKLGAHLPVDNILLRSSFGYRVHPITKRYAFHTGIDISARSANIYAVLHGSVGSCGYNSKLGNFIVLNHGNYTTVYGHLSMVFVNSGDLVKPGEVIGISGATGQVTGEHLHFTVKY
ncbi:MAG: M23 family metallopeptidase, partial [Hymenobacter sp.]